MGGGKKARFSRQFAGQGHIEFLFCCLFRWPPWPNRAHFCMVWKISSPCTTNLLTTKLQSVDETWITAPRVLCASGAKGLKGILNDISLFFRNCYYCNYCRFVSLNVIKRTILIKITENLIYIYLKNRLIFITR